MIECRLTGLTRKPHAEHHRGDASPAESEFLALIVYTYTGRHIQCSKAHMQRSLLFFLLCLSFIWLSFEMIFLYSLISISSSSQLQCWRLPVLRLSLGKRVRISAGEISSDFPAVRSCWNRACHWIGQTLCKAQPAQEGKIRLGSEKHRLSPSERSRKNWK